MQPPSSAAGTSSRSAIGHSSATQQPQWLLEGVAPSIAEIRDAQAQRSASQAEDVARKRLRAPVAVDPEARRLHQLIAAQLQHEGYTEAAAAVLRSTGCLGSATVAEGPAGQRLARLVRLADTVETLRVPHPTAGAHGNARDAGTAEAALYGGSVYTRPAKPEAYQFGELYSSLPLDRPLRCIGFSPQAEYIACGATNGCVRVYSAAVIAERALRADSAEKTAATRHGLVRTFTTLHDQSVEWVGFHPTAPVVISAGRDGRLALMDYTEPQGRPATELMAPSSPAVRAQVGSGASASTAAAAAGLAVDGRSRTADASACFQDTFSIRAAAIHPDGEHIALATDHHTLRLFNFTTGAVMAPTEAHRGAIADVSYNADGRLIATASYDGTWRVVDGRTGSTAHAPAAPTPAGLSGSAGSGAAGPHCGVAVTSCQLSTSGRILLTSGADNQTKLWDLRKSSTEVASYGEAQKVQHRLRSRFTFDEAAVVVDGPTRRTTEIIDIFSGVIVATLEHAQQQRGLACSPTAQLIATGGDDYRLRLWSPSTLTLLVDESRGAR